jgi:hypothetical protein
MMWATFGISASALAATLLDQPYAGLLLLPLVPLASVAGYLRQSGSDAMIAQHLDERLQTHELLASGVACRGKLDAGSALILAQAEVSAAATDRIALRSGNGISRSEVAAGLTLAIAMAISVARQPASERLPDLARNADEHAEVTQQAPNLASPTVNKPANHRVRPGRPDPIESEDEASGAASSESVRRPAGDASGDGRAFTSSKAPQAIPAARGTRDSLSPGDGTGPGSAGSESAVDGTTAVSSSGLARRVPHAVDSSSRPTEIARQNARRLLDAEQLDPDSRDLVRAYFDLDEPR